MPLRRGVLVGAGGVARLAHLPAYVAENGIASRLQIVAAVDSQLPPPVVGNLPVRASLDQLADLAPVDFVDICTPTATHHDLVLKSLAAGFHVFCEKPVAVTAEEAREMAGAARAARRVLFPCHQYRQNPAWRMLRTWLDAGAIGRWHLAEFSVYRPAADLGAATGGVPWRGTREASLGGVLLDHGSHYLYVLLDVAGMPDSVTANLSSLRHGSYDVEDTAHVILDYGGRLATLTLTWAGQQRENRIRFIGENGTIEWTGGVLTLSRSDGATESHDFTAQLDKKAYSGWVSRILEDFADAMDSGDAEPALTEIERVATLLESAYRSSADGTRVRLR